MKKPDKALLVFFNGKSNAGGAERMVLYLDEYLMSRGLKTEIIDERHLLNTAGGKIVQKLFRYRHFRKRKPIYMARLASAYLWTRKNSRQIVVSNGESTPFFPADFVVSQGCYHTMEKAYGRQSEELSRIARLQKRGLHMARQIITVTDKVKTELISYYGIAAEKISLVSNRVDTDYFIPMEQSPASEKTVLYVGRLEPGKGLDQLLKLAEIIEKDPQWKFLIACNNETNTALFEGFRRTDIQIGLQLENINGQGYAKAGIVIFPSLSESFGMVTIEALAAGVPVIATPVGIIPELTDRNYPGVHILKPIEDEGILLQFSDIIRNFRTQVNRTRLHENIRDEFGIASYRTRLDEVIGPSINLQ